MILGYVLHDGCLIKNMFECYYVASFEETAVVEVDEAVLE
jgi:hypothetical protein